MSLAGTSKFTGLADFGGGTDTLSIGGTSVFSGTLANSQGLAVSVAGGTFDVGGAATISSLAVDRPVSGKTWQPVMRSITPCLPRA